MVKQLYTCVFTTVLHNLSIETRSSLIICSSEDEARGKFTKSMEAEFPPHTRLNYQICITEIHNTFIERIKTEL